MRQRYLTNIHIAFQTEQFCHCNEPNVVAFNYLIQKFIHRI